MDLICGFVVSGLAFAGGQTDSTETATGVKEITIPLQSSLGLLDPVADWLRDVAANMFVSLVRYDHVKDEIVPAGATSWTVSDDGKTWTFFIRENWNWSNGDPVTAKDYEYAFQMIVKPETAAPIARRIFNIVNASAVNAGDMPVEDLAVKAIEKYTLQIEITEPAAWFLSSLTSVGHAVPRETRETYCPEWTQPENIVVSGPFIVTKWVLDDMLVLEKNPSYYDDASVDIDKINLLMIPENSTAMAMYENDELDTAIVPPEDLDRIKSDPVLGKEYYNGNQFNFHYYILNTNSPPFDNVLARKAFASAVDKQTLVERVTRGGEIPALTLTPPGSVGHVPASEGIGLPFNAEKAKSWLAQAGYPNGEGLPPIILAYNANELNANIAQAIQKMWKDNLGVTVDLKAWEGGGYWDAARAGAFNVQRAGWGMDFPDAHNVHAEPFRSKPVPEGTLPLFLAVPEYDEVVDAAAVELDPDKRYDLYKQAEKLYIEDHVGVIPIIWSAVNRVTKPYLERPNVPTYGSSWWLRKINE